MMSRRRKLRKSNMSRVIPILFLLLVLCGCASFKKDVGDYIKDSVVQSVEADLDKKLALRDTSIAEIQSVIAASGDGRLTARETIVTAKEMVKDFIVLEADKLVQDKVDKAKANLVTTDQLETHKGKFWNWLIITCGGGLLTFLGKAAHSLTVQKGFHSRLIVLEKLLGQNLEPED
jgi:hypothetical protein